MANKREISNLNQQIKGLQNLIETYEELAALQMRKNRTRVVNSRSFIEDLETIYHELMIAYHREAMNRLKDTFAKQRAQGRTIAVLLSSNVGLVGEIVQQTFKLFSEYIKTHPCDIMVTGRIGQRMMMNYLPDKKFLYYEVSDEAIDPQKLSFMINMLTGYEKIYIFYGKFNSFASQTPYVLDARGEQEKLSVDNVPLIKYLFEPSLNELFHFFETQIFSTIIEQTFRESNLAKYAARMVALNSATDNVSKYLKHLNLQQRVITHRIANQKQQQVYTSMTLWKLR